MVYWDYYAVSVGSCLVDMHVEFHIVILTVFLGNKSVHILCPFSIYSLRVRYGLSSFDCRMEAGHRRRLLPSCHDSLKYKAGILSYIRSLHFQVVVIQSLIRVVDIMRFQNSLYSFRYRDFLFDVFDITTLSNHKIVFGASFIESAGNLRFPAESAPKLRFSLDSPTPNRFPGSKSSDCFCLFSISDVVCCSKKFVGGLGVQP